MINTNWLVLAWSTANFLKLNDKTEVLHVTSRFRKSSDLPDISYW